MFRPNLLLKFVVHPDRPTHGPWVTDSDSMHRSTKGCSASPSSCPAMRGARLCHPQAQAAVGWRGPAEGSGKRYGGRGLPQRDSLGGCRSSQLIAQHKLDLRASSIGPPRPLQAGVTRRAAGCGNHGQRHRGGGLRAGAPAAGPLPTLVPRSLAQPSVDTPHHAPEASV